MFLYFQKTECSGKSNLLPVCYRSNILSAQKNCPPSETMTHIYKNSKNSASTLPCTSSPHAAAGPSAITLWRTPTKLTGNLALPLLDTPLETSCAIFITFNEMSTVLHHIGFFAMGGGGEESCSAPSAAAAAQREARKQRSGGGGGGGGGSATA